MVLLPAGNDVGCDRVGEIAPTPLEGADRWGHPSAVHTQREGIAREEHNPRVRLCSRQTERRQPDDRARSGQLRPLCRQALCRSRLRPVSEHDEHQRPVREPEGALCQRRLKSDPLAAIES